MDKDIGLEEAEALYVILEQRVSLEEPLEKIDPAVLTDYIIEAGYPIDFYTSGKHVGAIRLVVKAIMEKRKYSNIPHMVYLLTYQLVNYHFHQIKNVIDIFDYDNEKPNDE